MIIKRGCEEAAMDTGMTELCEQVNPSLLREMRQARPFPEMRRLQESWVAANEKSAVLWLAGRTPQWNGPDHLTALGLGARVGRGPFFFVGSRYRHASPGVDACL